MSWLDWLLLLALLFVAGLYLAARRRIDAVSNLVAASSPTQPAGQPSELLSVLDSLPVGVIVTDQRSVVRRYNPAAAAMLGFDPERQPVLGHSLIEVARDYELAAALRSTLLGSPGLARPALNIPYNKRYLRVSTCALPAEAGATLAALVVLEDITEIRRVERVRRDFVANVSHEFRTPLATAKLLVETAEDALPDDPAEASAFLERANHELDDMAHLVSELLDLARIEAGQTPIEPQPVSLVGVLAKAVARFQAQAEQAGLQLSLQSEAEVTVLADEQRLSQVLGNLIQNAIKFTPAGGTITVNVKREEAEQVAEVSVADTGIGIPPDDLERVFERFYKVDRARSAMLEITPEAASGTGLGLAIARHIVEGQGGHIWAESKLQEGTSFHFTMPLAQATAAA